MKIRLVSQLLFFSIVAIALWFSIESIHAICPFGGVVTIYHYITEGLFIQKIHESSFALMSIGFVIAILFGAAFCGWICPFGSIQEWMGKLGKTLFGKRYNHFIPKKLDMGLRYFRYIVLAYILYMTITTTKLFFESYDPYKALFDLFNKELQKGGLIVLLGILFLSLFVERPWCKYACPYGAVIGIFNRFSLYKIKRENKSCIQCKKCDRVCPMNIEISKKTKIQDHQCIRCMECTSENACPIQNTVSLITGGK